MVRHQPCLVYGKPYSSHDGVARPIARHRLPPSGLQNDPVDSAVLPIDTAFKHDRIVSAINCGGRPAAAQQGEAHEYTNTWDFRGAAGRGPRVPGASAEERRVGKELCSTGRARGV